MGVSVSPVAWRTTVSLVDICPSTVIRSNEPSTAWRRAASGSEICASVCTKQSMVAKPGWIIPAPFAWAEIVTPPALTLRFFGERSVVMIARVKPVARSRARLPAAFRTPSVTRSISSGTPITPVSATTTSRSSRPSASAVAALHLERVLVSPARRLRRSRCRS